MTNIKIANAPCSWGVLEFDLPGEALGFAQVLDEIRDTGYSGTELGDWGFMPTDPAALRRELDTRKLAMLGAFVQVAFSNPQAHAKGAEAAVRTAKLLAAVAGESPFIVLADNNATDPVRTKKAGRITTGEGLTDADWSIFAKGIEQVAKSVREQTGLRCVVHPHAAGFIETPDEIARFLELTDPQLVGLCFDTGHYLFGGGDPVEGLRRHRNRIWHMHFKDCSPAVHQRSRTENWDYFTCLKHGIFCELGKGGVDFPAVVNELRKTNYDGWIVVEQDVLPGMGAPKQYARHNREYLQTLGL